MITTLANTRFTNPAARVTGPAWSFAGLLDRIAAWGEIARQRHALSELDAERLRDIGVDPEAAAREAARPFWDAPAGR